MKQYFEALQLKNIPQLKLVEGYLYNILKNTSSGVF